MPPPPPSKSYLLVFDTDSEDEEDDSYRIRSMPAPAVTAPSEPPEGTTPMTSAAADTMRRRPHVIEDKDTDDDFEEEEAAHGITNDSQNSPGGKLSKSQKKKRARKRAKKKKSKTTSNKSVGFSTVSVQVYPRAFSADAIPADGGWPLGMELKPLEECFSETNVEDFEKEKQIVLQKRWEEAKAKVDEKVEKQLTTRPTGEPLVYETRQWDFRSKIKNPLFGIVEEEVRQTLLLDSSPEEAQAPSPKKGRNRSNSVNSYQDSSSPSKRRGRSSSFSHSERFNETYNQVYVHHVRNELEQLRTSRTKVGATGCNCRKLTVYIPPKDGGGKKAQHRRLKPSKLTQELKKRGLYDASASREALEHTLHDAVKAEPCCSSEDCFCYRNGIECQDDACSCWHDSHGHTKNGNPLGVEDIVARCGNPLGTATVDIGAIQSFRKKVLDSTVCQPVGGLVQ